MKTIYLLLLLQVCYSGYAQQLPIVTCASSFEGINLNYSKAKAFQAILEELTQLGVPGSAMAIYSSEGWWTSSAGYAKIEDKTVMQPCYLMHLQSVAKTYMAVSILKLKEEGKIDIEQPITTYLPAKFSKYISTPEKITVKMLLNHTSGMPEYNLSPTFVALILQHPSHHFEAEDYLSYIQDRPLDFEPGSKYSYRNTNYVLLSLISDAITGDHARYIRENVFKPIGLTQTFYRGSEGYINYPHLVNSYWDRHSDSIVENISVLQNSSVASCVGDDGIVATSIEAVKFLKGLMEGKIISSTSLELMKTWVNGKDGKPTYGYGLDHATFVGHTGYGHSGGGVGAGCQLYYFPEKNIYLFVGVNLGTLTESPLHQAVEKVIEKIYSTLLN